jgi:hypothetical protein
MLVVVCILLIVEVGNQAAGCYVHYERELEECYLTCNNQAGGGWSGVIDLPVNDEGEFVFG